MNSTNNGSTHDLVSRNCLIALAALSGANVIAHLIALPSLPAQIPTHWGASGEVNDWGPSWMAAALGALPLGMLALIYVIPRIDPKGNGYARAGKFYQRFVVGVTLLMIAISWLPELTVWGVIAAKGSTNVIVSVLIGALLVGIGNYMPRIGQNYTMGVKTPLGPQRPGELAPYPALWWQVLHAHGNCRRSIWPRGTLPRGRCCRSGDQRGLPWGMHRDVRLFLPAVCRQDSLRDHPHSPRQAQASTFPSSHDSANGSGPAVIPAGALF